MIRTCTAELAYGSAASLSPLAVASQRKEAAHETSAVDPMTEDPVKRDALDEVHKTPPLLSASFLRLSVPSVALSLYLSVSE